MERRRQLSEVMYSRLWERNEVIEKQCFYYKIGVICESEVQRFIGLVKWFCSFIQRHISLLRNEYCLIFLCCCFASFKENPTLKIHDRASNGEL